MAFNIGRDSLVVLASPTAQTFVPTIIRVSSGAMKCLVR
jgi:hypothetical protein